MPNDWPGWGRMTCCGTWTEWIEPKPGGRWGGNEWFEVERCPNDYCPTNVKVSDA